MSTVGTWNAFAALARPTVALMIDWRSSLPTPKNICGWWSTNSITELSDVSRSGLGSGNDIGDVEHDGFLFFW